MPDDQKARALYLRWRPQTFTEVVGQEHVTRTLRNAVRSGRLAHAYLLCGPRGTGKTSLARILYRAANCAEPMDGNPCGVCATCTAAAAGRAMDLVEVDAASNRGIDDIRQLRERVAYSPSEGRYRVYIIDEAHELTTPAWDAFLKTLEEPPPHTIFVLATTEAHKVPPTIVSRCQRFDLRRIELGALRTQLSRVAEAEELQVEPAVLDCLARMARGGLRDALSLMDQLRAYAGDHLTLPAARALLGVPSLEAVRGLLEAVETGDAASALDRLASVLDEGVDVRQFASEVVAHLRGLLLVRRGAASALTADFSADDLAWLEQRAPGWSPERLLALTRGLSDGLARLRDPLQLELHIELALLENSETEPESERQREKERRGEEGETRRRRPERGTDGASESTLAIQSEAPGPDQVAHVTEHMVASTQQEPAASPEQSTPPNVEHSALNPQPSAAKASPAPLTADLVRVRWPELMELLRGRNAVVAAMLQAAEVLSLAGSGVQLAVGYAFHVRQLNDPKNRTVVEDALSELLGQSVRVTCSYRAQQMSAIDEQDLEQELERLMHEDPVLRRAVDLWGRNLTIID